MDEWVKENKVLMGFGIVGVGLLVIGGITFVRGQLGHQTNVEVISTNESTSPSDEIVWVDVEGAVVNPGVYELKSDVRVNEALTAAGGMSEAADRIWVRRFINLAQKIPDGAKIYIPTIGEADNSGMKNEELRMENEQGGQVAGMTIGMGAETSGLVNINTASTGELDKLWGIGEKRAGDIVTNRPYSNKEELMSKAGIPKNVFERIREEVGI